MQPSMGRTVIYNHSGSKDGKFSPMKSPAIIQNVYDDNVVDLVVFSSAMGGGIFFARKIAIGDDSSRWNWPPRVDDGPKEPVTLSA